MNKGLYKNALLILLLSMFTILVNWPVFHYHSMYSEQPIIYIANHAIHNLKDLFNVYLHPKMLEMEIPFFRPSGHFLLYQLLTPLFGWYNQNALLAVNFVFLAVIGFLIIKLYAEFFPGFYAGGWIAFAFYLMQPALILGRITLMHFEFAYVMFLLAGLYGFVIFCKKNLIHPFSLETLQFKHFSYYAGFLIFFMLAVTFKESALMLGPVSMCYFILVLYDAQPHFLRRVFKNKAIIYIISFTILLTGLLALYLTQSWGARFSNPLRVVSLDQLGPLDDFLRYLLSLTGESTSLDDLFKGSRIFRQIQTPPLVHLLVWFLLLATFFSWVKIYLQPAATTLKKSILFLGIALLLFMLLPFGWGMAYPWHLSLSLVCESFLLGFGLEYASKTISNNSRWVTTSGLVFALILALTTYEVDTSNINFLAKTEKGISWRMTYNAVMHPPMLQHKLDHNSLLIVEDSQNIGDYQLGDSTYPLMLIANNDKSFDGSTFSNFMHQDRVFVRIDPTYDSTLFRFAYDLPDLKEEMISFKISPLNQISNRLLLSWLRRLDNIYAVAYDNNGNWFDDTDAFKKNIQQEQQRRHLGFSRYSSSPETALSANAILAKNLPYPDPELCQSVCDTDHECKGFTYIHAKAKQYFIAQCFFYHKITAAGKPCKVCTGFVKAV